MFQVKIPLKCVVQKPTFTLHFASYEHLRKSYCQSYKVLRGTFSLHYLLSVSFMYPAPNGWGCPPSLECSVGNPIHKSDQELTCWKVRRCLPSFTFLMATQQYFFFLKKSHLVNSLPCTSIYVDWKHNPVCCWCIQQNIYRVLIHFEVVTDRSAWINFPTVTWCLSFPQVWKLFGQLNPNLALISPYTSCIFKVHVWLAETV